MHQPHTPPLYGLILAGGQSRRMGENKALIDYHGLPQAQYTYQLLKPYCEIVLLSCGKSPLADIPASIPQVCDAYQNIGPLAGVLSVMERYPQAAWLVMACDMPGVDEAAVQLLINHRHPERDVTLFEGQESFPEPLFAIYEPTCLPIFQQALQTGNSGLRFLLRKLKIECITQQQQANSGVSGDFLCSVNTPLEAKEWRKFPRKHS